MGAPPTRPTRALVVGRFQPPHRGHLACLRHATTAADETLVVVGSAQRSHTARDPFTAGERIEMLHAAAADEGLRLDHVIPVPDLDMYHLWVAHVDALVPAYDVVVTASPMTAHLFAKAGRRVERIDAVRRTEWSGTAIRARLAQGQDPEDALTPGVRRLLRRPDIDERLRALAAADAGHHG